MRIIRAIAILSAILIASCSLSRNPATPTSAAFAIRAAQPSSEIVLETFSSPTYGNSLPSPLTPDGSGNYYGTTSVGGLGDGTLYELSPNGKGGWNNTVIHAFKDSSDGRYPEFTPLIFDKNGDLYGTTMNGGSNGLGVAFRFHHAASGWVESVLHNFGNGDAYPFNSLIRDSSDNLYGTDNVYHDGGAITEGVYEISPSHGGWTFKIIYDVGMPAANGASGGLVMDTVGNIFGLSTGSFKPAVVFELKPVNGNWNSSVLYTFQSIAEYPLGAPVLDKSGNIYGTTADGGTRKQGSIYRLSPSKSGPWTFETLYSFKGGAAGSGPYAGITFDASGNVYGTTIGGGTSNKGTVFKLTAGSYNEKVLWSFDGKDGNKPMTPVVLNNGNVFGTTSTGGGTDHCLAKAGCGNAFEIAR